MDNNEFMKLIVSHLERIETKVDRLDERADTQERVSIIQESNLREHMRRSDLLEQSQDDLKQAVTPIIKVYTIAWGITKIIAGVAVVIGIIESVKHLVN